MEPGWWKVKVAWVLSAPPPALRTPGTAARLLAGARALRRPASERASEGGRRARPGPSCPYDRAGRRRALPSHGKRRPRGGGGPAGLRRERAARLLGTDCPGAPAGDTPPRRPRAPVSFPSLRAGRLRRPAAAPGAAVLPWEGEAAHPIARRRTLRHPLAGERGPKPRAEALCQLCGSPCLSLS